MPTTNNAISILKDACQLTSASWAACVERDERGDFAWHFNAAFRLHKKGKDIIQNYFSLHTTDTWLCGAVAGGKARSRKLPEDFGLGVERLFLFPVRGTQKLLLVGGAELSKKDKQIWRLLATTGNFCEDNLHLQPVDSFIFGGHTTTPYDLSGSLARILARIVQYIPCEAAWLAIYGEKTLKIEAHWNIPAVVGKEFSLEDGHFLSAIKEKMTPFLIKRDSAGWHKMRDEIVSIKAEVWGILPLKIGQRLIGAVALCRDDAFSEDEWLKLQQLSLYAAAAVETFATFSEMAGHLRRQAMLNDFALVASSAQNLGQIIRRVFALLSRIFGTEQISLFLLSSDERTLREYRNVERRTIPRTEFLEGHHIEAIIEARQNIRIEDAKEEKYILGTEDTRSALLVLLKYRGEVIGVLALESKEMAAFSGYDENLLVVIASHLAGLVEYGRLREEAEARARNLGLIHEVIQQVIGQTNIDEVAQTTADLLVQYFSYELAVVLLVGRDQRLNIAGISGEAAPIMEEAFENSLSPAREGISGQVFASGESIMADDVRKNEYYKKVPGWEAGSEICVALKDGNRVLGIIDVEASEKNAFSHNDLLALESLAGFLTSAVSSVDRYQMLQDTIQILQKTQEEVQERMDAQHAAENQLIQAAKLAAVGEMAAGVAHELNNPLTTVAGFTELVLEDLAEDSHHREDLVMVLREAKRARSVVRRLLDFSRQSESVRVRADLNEVIEDVAALTRHLLATNNIDFELQLDENLPWVLIDRDRIKQVVLNLLHNALQAMGKGGKLLVDTELRQRNDVDWVVMVVQDSGKGISVNDLARIFEPFFTTKADDGGTGLGLAVSYGIVKDHGGFISVDSKPNEGARFTVWLPIEGEID